jgi:hypothetical protein
MNFKVSGRNASATASAANSAPTHKKRVETKNEPITPKSTKPKDQLHAQSLPEGQGLSQVSLVDNAAENPLLEARLEKISQLLENSEKHSLSLPEKEIVLKLLKASKKDGSIQQLAERLNDSEKLLPLYQKMGSLANRSPGTSALLGLVTLGLSLGEEAKSNRAIDMKEILTEGGVSAEILAELND